MSQPSKPPPITDSPWFWFAVFSAFGLAALLATGGKFGKRQAGIENRYKARAAVAEGFEIETDAAGNKTTAKPPDYSTPDKLEIPLWPIELTLLAILVGSVAMLVRNWKLRDDTPTGRAG